MNSLAPTISDFLQKKIPGLQGIYLFGSHADGTATPDSDVDVAYLAAHTLKLSGMENFELTVALGGLLDASVDLVDLQAVTTDFRFIIVSTGQRIFCADADFCDAFEIVSYSMYQRLEEERREIVEDIKKRGTIYG